MLENTGLISQKHFTFMPVIVFIDYLSNYFLYPFEPFSVVLMKGFQINWFLTFSTQLFSLYIICANNTNCFLEHEIKYLVAG